MSTCLCSQQSSSPGPAPPAGRGCSLAAALRVERLPPPLLQVTVLPSMITRRTLAHRRGPAMCLCSAGVKCQAACDTQGTISTHPAAYKALRAQKNALDRPFKAPSPKAALVVPPNQAKPFLRSFLSLVSCENEPVWCRMSLSTATARCSSAPGWRCLVLSAGRSTAGGNMSSSSLSACPAHVSLRATHSKNLRAAIRIEAPGWPGLARPNFHVLNNTRRFQDSVPAHPPTALASLPCVW